jgi:ABC-type sugar transport system ATPase subunit
MTSTADIVLEARGISKSFPGVRALNHVSLSLRRGRLTALLGENGAGKSTLMNIIAGVFPPDEGEVILDGQAVRFVHPRAARDAGIAMIYQELNLVAHLTVAENIFLGREPLNRLGLIDRATMNREATKLLAELDLEVAPNTPLGQLRVGQQQIIEIAKALSTRARVLIMDEPTSAITQHEIEVLFGVIKKLKQQGVAIAYITHKLEELTRIGDDAVVMRDGNLIGSGELAELSREEIVKMMVGRDIRSPRQRERTDLGEQVLRVEKISLPHPERTGDFLLRDIDFAVRRGEVLGIFGLMGAGRTELLECIFGLHPKTSTGTVHKEGETIRINAPADAIAHGLALAPEDRKREGLILGMTVLENASLASLSRYDRAGLLDSAAEQRMATAVVDRFKVKTPSVQQTIRNLSGGNQQKVILGKWLATEPAVVLLDEPTRGIDVQAKEEIYQLIHQLSSDGLAVVFVSSEMPEVLAMADRIVVLCEGRKTGVFTRAEANEESLMQAALPANSITS